jgi:hypothetical protein
MRDLGEADFKALYAVANDIDAALFDQIQESRRRAIEGLEPLPPDGGPQMEDILRRRSEELTDSTQSPQEGEQ